jgi:protein-S-isoprenylcysteine O-methyltransferase Ste14
MHSVRAKFWANTRWADRVKITRAAVGTVIFTLFVPGVIGGWIPYTLTADTGVAASWWARLAGWVMILLGTAGYLWCASNFVRQGLGTPAPIAAPERLVVRGPYRFTRNPMYVSVMLVILGQAALRWSGALLLYAAFVLLAFQLFVLLYEEPALTRRFGDDYLQYRRTVPRWIGARSNARGAGR